MKKMNQLALIAGLFLLRAQGVSAAAVFSDLTASATLTDNGYYNIYVSERLRDGSFFGTEWITAPTTEAWAEYSWATGQYLAYVLLGGNAARVPNGMKVQYSILDDGTWVDAGSVQPGSGARLYYVPIGVTAKAVRVMLTRASATYSDLFAFRVYGAATAPIGTLTTAVGVITNATVQTVNTWEGLPANLAVAWGDTAAGADSPRANGDMASKPQAVLIWSSDQYISGVALANGTWWYSGGAIVAMTVEALTEGVDPGVADPSDWSTVFTYSDSTTGAKLIDARFDSGSVITRALRLTVSDVQDAAGNPPRAGGVMSEVAILGGLIPPPPPTGTAILLR